MQSHYTKLLSPHFSGEQVETLIKLIDLMQDPFSFEIGILQLRAQNLYEPLMQFLLEYVEQWEGLCRRDTILEYMFGNNIECRFETNNGEWWFCDCITQSEVRKGGIIASHIVLPLFCKVLTNLHIITYREPQHIFANLEDVDYPFQSVETYAIDEILTSLPSQTYELTIRDGLDEFAFAPKHFPMGLKKLCIYPRIDNIKNLEVLLHLTELKTFGYTGNGRMDGLKFPPNIEEILELDFPPYLSNVGDMEYILSQNPKLQRINCDYLGTETMEVMKKHSFIYKQKGWFERELDHIP